MSELLGRYVPTAVQFPADGHETEVRLTCGPDAASAGRTASTPVAQCPAFSVSNSPCWAPAPSVYEPTALQYPREAQEIASMLTAVSSPVAAFAGSGATVARQRVFTCDGGGDGTGRFCGGGGGGFGPLLTMSATGVPLPNGLPG